MCWEGSYRAASRCGVWLGTGAVATNSCSGEAPDGSATRSATRNGRAGCRAPGSSTEIAPEIGRVALSVAADFTTAADLTRIVTAWSNAPAGTSIEPPSNVTVDPAGPTEAVTSSPVGLRSCITTIVAIVVATTDADTISHFRGT